MDRSAAETRADSADASGGTIFISYSRADYYFAESLALALTDRGIPTWLDAKDLTPGTDWQHAIAAALDRASTILVVVSPESVRSDHVRREWIHALSTGKRLGLARFRAAHLPHELEKIDAIDFRGFFVPAVAALVAWIGQDATVRPTRHHRSLRLPLPPAVIVVTLLLAVAIMLPLCALLAGGILDALSPNGSQSLPMDLFLLVVVGWLTWYCCLAYVRRRMTMYRVAMCFGLASLFWGTQLLGGVAPAAAAGWPIGPLPPDLFQSWTPLLILSAAACAAVTGLFIVIFSRPGDVLRWAVTGSAWDSYRGRRPSFAAPAPTGTMSRLPAVPGFRLLNDPIDRRAAAHLRQQLVAAGGSAAASGAECRTAVFLLTNRTRKDWLTSQRSLFDREVLTVVGTTIRLDAAFDWIWQNQWIDFRAWSSRETRRGVLQPDVPESVGYVRLPASINAAHHLLCSLCGLEILTSQMLSSVILQHLLIAGLCGRLAGRFLRRAISRGAFFAWATAMLCWGLLRALITVNHAHGLRTLAPLLFAAGLCVWLFRHRRDLSFWFPAFDAPGGTRGSSLGPIRNWRTVAFCGGYALLWFLVLEWSPP